MYNSMYNNNDYRSYLAHHGILGQKWGVRRFQAYGSGGYDRKGGKTGKVVGEAKASRAERKEAKRAAVAENYKAKEIAKLDKRMDRLTQKYGKAGAKLKERKETLEQKYEFGEISEKNFNKKYEQILSKVGSNAFQYNYEHATAQLEKSKVMNYTYDDVKKEKRYVAAGTAAIIGADATAVGIAATMKIPFVMVALPNISNMKTNSRLNNDDRDKVINAATVATYTSRAVNDKRSELASRRKDARYMTSKTDESTSRNVYNHGLSKKDKTNMMNDAKNNRYSIDFLEAIQNKKLVSSKDNGAVMKEYSKYLDNPRNYWENERHKLEDD